MSQVAFDIHIADARAVKRWADRVEVLVHRRRMVAASSFETAVKYSQRAGWALGLVFGSQALATVLALVRNQSVPLAIIAAALSPPALLALILWLRWQRRADRASAEGHRLRGAAEGLAESAAATFLGPGAS